jgi:hypothetical protein
MISTPLYDYQSNMLSAGLSGSGDFSLSQFNERRH